MDPWLYLRQSEVLNGTLKLDVPFIAVNSEYFAEICNFDIWGCLKVLVTNSSHNDNPTRSLKVKNMYHAHQTDIAVISPLEIAFDRKIWPNPSIPYKYFMHT